MTVLTTEQARILLAKLPRPTKCDRCSKTSPLEPRKAGPFTVWLCATCSAPQT